LWKAIFNFYFVIKVRAKTKPKSGKTKIGDVESLNSREKGLKFDISPLYIG